MYRNILFFGAGSIIGPEYIKWIKKTGSVKQIVAVDCDPLASGFALADISVVIPKVTDSRFVQELQDVIDKYNIDYVFPFIEIGHNQLMQVKANFGNDLIAGALCKDKYTFYKQAKDVGIPVPNTYLMTDYTNQIEYPVYIKPRNGDGSKDNYKITTEEKLDGFKKLYSDRITDFMVQEFLTGQHWAADIVVENGEVIKVVTRKSKDRVYRIEICPNTVLEELCKVVQKKLNIQSIFNLEAFEISPNTFVVNEINARIGGNCITSCLAGCDIISYLLTKDRSYLKDPIPGIYTYAYERYKVG